MNAALFIALYFAIPVGMLILCGTLVRASARRAGRSEDSSCPLVRDLRPWEDALVDFIANSNDSSAILSTLATRCWPMPFRALVDELRLQSTRDEDRNDASLSGIRSVLPILQIARLVGMSRTGFWLTDAGHEVHRRMLSRTESALPSRLEDRHLNSDPQLDRGAKLPLAQSRKRVLRAA